MAQDFERRQGEKLEPLLSIRLNYVFSSIFTLQKLWNVANFLLRQQSLSNLVGSSELLMLTVTKSVMVAVSDMWPSLLLKKKLLLSNMVTWNMKIGPLEHCAHWQFTQTSMNMDHTLIDMATVAVSISNALKFHLIYLSKIS